MTDAETKKYLAKVAKEIGEHVDAVVILASWHDHTGTDFYYPGAGNVFTRRAMAEDYLKTEQNKEQASELVDALKAAKEEE